MPFKTLCEAIQTCHPRLAWIPVQSTEAARSDVFDYIEMFYNAKRRHGFNNQLSSVEFEKRYA